MGEYGPRDFVFYVRGCEKLGVKPVDVETFVVRYNQFCRCERLLKAYAELQAHRPDLDPKERESLAVLIKDIRQARTSLAELAALVSAGRGNGEGGDDGVGAALRPAPPVLTGKAAKLHPDLDPEPRWRNEVI